MTRSRPRRQAQIEEGSRLVASLLAPLVGSELTLRALAELAAAEGQPVSLEDLESRLGASKPVIARALQSAVLLGIVDRPGFGPRAGQRRARVGTAELLAQLVNAAQRVRQIRAATEGRA